MRWIMGLGMALLGAGLSAGGALAQAKKETLTFTSPSRNGQVTVTAELFLPDAPAGVKLPAMLIHHGSGGVTDSREYAYAREFSAMGVASIIPDSFTPRGVKSTVSDQSTVSTNDMITDAFNALKAAAAHPRIDIERVGITGFSKGGTVATRTALQIMLRRNEVGNLKFALHVPFYPGCDVQYLNVQTTGAPILMLLGAADTYVGIENCQAVAAKMKAEGATIDVVVYPNAQHGWDGTGRNWEYSNGENYSKCFFIEQPDRSWIEQTSQVMTLSAGARPVPGAQEKAIAGCRRMGVSGGPDAKAKAESLAAMKAAMREYLKLN